MQHWVFGYGSLIWKADFPYHERRRAAIGGWMRRFWQGSHDHRGTPEAPGRVVTLVRTDHAAGSAPAACIGVAYRVDEAVFAHLDYREKNGYRRVDVDIHLCAADGAGGAAGVVRGLTYIGEASNAAFLGPASLDDIAAQISRSSGPSGSNVDYLLALHRALAQLGAADRHVDDLARIVTASAKPAPARYDEAARRKGGVGSRTDA